MKKNLIMLYFIALPFLLTGCEYDYNIKVTEDLKIKESLSVNEQKDIYAEDNPADPFLYYEGVKDEIKQELLNLNYKVVDESTTDRVKFNLTRESAFDGFNSYILNDIYDKVESYCTSDKCVLNANLSETRQEDDNEGNGTYVDYNIKITVPYKVISNNADEVDLQRNTFIWYYINAGKKSDINLIFEKSGQNIIVANRNTRIFWTSVWTVLGVIVMIIIIRIIYKIRKSSRPNF